MRCNILVNHLRYDYRSDYLRLLAIRSIEPLNSLRGQFWGRAALAPEVLIGSGRFLFALSSFRDRANSLQELRCSESAAVPALLDYCALAPSATFAQLPHLMDDRFQLHWIWHSAARRIMAGIGVLEVSDATFDQEVLRSEQPVLVDFWAVWCGPCKAIAPIVDSVAATYAGKLKVAKVNVDREWRHPFALRRSRHSCAFVFQRRQSGRPDRRLCPAEM